jgi:hypothetical protein
MSTELLLIAIKEGERWWCTCARMHEGEVTGCECGRTAEELLPEMAYNGKVTAWIEGKPIDWGLPTFGESKASWWARMCESYDAERACPAAHDSEEDSR